MPRGAIIESPVDVIKPTDVVIRTHSRRSVPTDGRTDAVIAAWCCRLSTGATHAARVGKKPSPKMKCQTLQSTSSHTSRVALPLVSNPRMLVTVRAFRHRNKPCERLQRVRQSIQTSRDRRQGIVGVRRRALTSEMLLPRSTVDCDARAPL